MDRFQWTEKTLAEIKQLWMDGYTARQIGDLYGISRGAVTGKMWREGMPTRDEASRRKAATVRTKKKVKTAPNPKPATKLSGLRPRQPTPLPVVMEQKSNPPLKGILELKDGDCRFPVGEPENPGFGFCAKPVASGQVYCADCCSKAFNRQGKKTKADEVARAA